MFAQKPEGGSSQSKLVVRANYHDDPDEVMNERFARLQLLCRTEDKIMKSDESDCADVDFEEDEHD
jgi:hypothetical protein